MTQYIMKNYTPQTIAEHHLQLICTMLWRHGWQSGIHKSEVGVIKELIDKYADKTPKQK